MTTTTYKGFGCEAVLDTDAGTVTLTHAGMTVAKHKKESSPWVIPLGAITEVEFKEKTVLARGWVRFILTDRVGWAKNEIEDVNALLSGKEKVGEFVDAVNAARQFAKPTTMTTQPAPSMVQRMQARGDELSAKADAFNAQRAEIRAEQSGLRPDIHEARERMFGKIGVSRELKNLESHLWGAETVSMMCAGQYGRGQGLLVLTNTRLLFVFHGIMGQTTEDFPLDKISSIQWSAGVVMGTITIFASGNKAEISNVVKADGKAIVDRVRAILSGQAPGPSAAPTSPTAAPTPVAAPAAPTPPPPPPPSVPADWYPDANNPALLRYWDGAQWTEHTAPRAV